MLTIFSIPKPFTDPHIGFIQRNAIKSWKKLHPDIEVILIGNEAGVMEISKELNLTHIPNVALSKYGTPLLDSAFELTRNQARHELLLYSNADIIMTSSIIEAAKSAPREDFLICGRRWDLDMKKEIDFDIPDWEKDLLKKVNQEGNLHSPAGIDYFLFRKGSLKNLPTLIVGRMYWDNWMIANARRSGLMLIDASAAVTAIHQNHAFPKGLTYADRKSNPEGLHNLEFISPSDRRRELTILAADHQMRTDYSIVKNYFTWIHSVKKMARSLIGK